MPQIFYVDLLGLLVIFQDGIVVVLRAGLGRVVLHRNDRGHDERGIFPVGVGATGVAIRFSVDDPDAWESEANQRVRHSMEDPGGFMGKISGHWRSSWQARRPGQDEEVRVSGKT